MTPAEGTRSPAYDALTDDQKAMGLDLAGVGLTSVDYVAGTVTPDARVADLFGLEAGVPVTREAFHDRIHPDDRDAVLAEVDRLLDPGFDDVVDLVHRTVTADGSTRWVHARKALYRDERDPLRPASTGVAAIVDVTAAREAEERSGLLIRELHHRTNNIVAVVATLARMIMRSGAPESFIERFEPRLYGLASRLLLPKDDEEGIDLATAVRAALEPFVLEEGQLALDGEAVRLTGDEHQAIAMAVHELATNAVKHGALSRPGGRVAIAWSLAADGALAFSWQESGGPPVVRPTRTGFGTHVLDRLMAVSVRGRARTDYAPHGLRYDLEMRGEGGKASRP